MRGIWVKIVSFFSDTFGKKKLGKNILGTSSNYFKLVKQTENKVKKVTNSNNTFVIGNNVTGNYGKEEYIRK